MTGRLSTLAAAWVVARRDFTAILFSRSFFFFLLGPLFPVLVGVMASGVGSRVQDSAASPQLGLVMDAHDSNAMLAARRMLEPGFGAVLPQITMLRRLSPGETFDVQGALTSRQANVAAILSGTPAHPRLTGPQSQIERWQGPVAIIAAQAVAGTKVPYPQVTLQAARASSATQRRGQLATAQAAQTLLFLLTMLLAGMVLSNLVEEKANKIIEVLAAAIPMDAVFLGKLFAMLGVSLVGIAAWATVVGVILATGGHALPVLTAPAVGWPLMVTLGIAYFALAYLLLGSVFLTIGSMATTVREVQTLSMPVTMLQLVVFFFASFAMTQPGSPPEIAAIVFPFSSPFVMMARAAQQPQVWPHLLALAWQVACVVVLVRIGAKLFRKRVMQSGPKTARRSRMRLAIGRKGRCAS